MFAINLKVLQNVLTVMDIETEVKKLLIYQCIDYASKLIHNRYNIYTSLLDNPHSKFLMVDINKILIYQQCHHPNFIISPNTTDADILYKFTEDEWNRLCIDYIAEKIRNPSKVQIQKPLRHL